MLFEAKIHEYLMIFDVEIEGYCDWGWDLNGSEVAVKTYFYLKKIVYFAETTLVTDLRRNYKLFLKSKSKF